MPRNRTHYDEILRLYVTFSRRPMKAIAHDLNVSAPYLSSISTAKRPMSPVIRVLLRRLMRELIAKYERTLPPIDSFHHAILVALKAGHRDLQ